MMLTDVLNIEEAFGDIQDPRSRTPAHDLMQILVVALCAVLSGAENWVAIQVWGKEKLEWLRYTPLIQDPLPHDTFGRDFAAPDPTQFEACFMRWMSPLLPDLVDQVVAIDGKTVRGSREAAESAIHLA